MNGIFVSPRYNKAKNKLNLDIFNNTDITDIDANFVVYNKKIE